MKTENQEIKLQYLCNNFRFHYSLERPTSLEPYYKHCHSCYELYAFVDGEVDFIVESVSYNMKPFTILLIPPHKYHYANILKLNKNYHRFTFLFNPNFLPESITSSLENEVKMFTFNKENLKLFNHFNNIQKALKQFDAKDKELFLSLFLCDILLDLKYSKNLVFSPISYITNDAVCNILNFINEHIYEKLSVEIIAKKFYLSPVYISQIFSKTMHISLMRYIKQKKLLLAEDLIRNGDKPTNIASLLGYTNYSTFFRLYKKEFGYAPSDKI